MAPILAFQDHPKVIGHIRVWNLMGNFLLMFHNNRQSPTDSAPTVRDSSNCAWQRFEIATLLKYLTFKVAYGQMSCHIHHISLEQ